MKSQGWNIAQVNPLSQLATEETGGSPQNFQAVLLILGVPEEAHIDMRLAQIGAGFDIRDGHEIQARVRHFSL